MFLLSYQCQHLAPLRTQTEITLLLGTHTAAIPPAVMTSMVYTDRSANMGTMYQVFWIQEHLYPRLLLGKVPCAADLLCP